MVAFPVDKAYPVEFNPPFTITIDFTPNRPDVKLVFYAPSNSAVVTLNSQNRHYSKTLTTDDEVRWQVRSTDDRVNYSANYGPTWDDQADPTITAGFTIEGAENTVTIKLARVVTRKLTAAQIEFFSPAGDDDQGKDHDTEMLVELFDRNGARSAVYTEGRFHGNEPVPGLGSDFPQGYAPNTDVVRDMRVERTANQIDLKTGHLKITWQPHGGIGSSSDVWHVDVRVILYWDTGDYTTTIPVRYDNGPHNGNVDHPLSFP